MARFGSREFFLTAVKRIWNVVLDNL